MADAPRQRGARHRVVTFRQIERRRKQPDGAWKVEDPGKPVDEQCNEWCDKNNCNPIEASTHPHYEHGPDTLTAIYILTAIVVDREEQMQQEAFLRGNQAALPAERVAAQDVNTQLPPEVTPDFDEADDAPKHDVGDALSG